MSAAHEDLTAIVIVFFTIALPIALGFALAAYSIVMRHRQLEMIVRERELLIEKGVTDLPPLKLPGTEKRANGHGNLKWGLILVAVGAVSVGLRFLGFPVDAGRHWMLDLGALSMAVGLALIVFHFIARAYHRQDAELSKPEEEA